MRQRSLTDVDVSLKAYPHQVRVDAYTATSVALTDILSQLSV
jgi:hypothetical protein